jgi:hypothetical protein
MMKKLQWVFLLLAIAGTACIMGIGIFVALKNVIGIIGCIVLIIFIMGFGFMKKKKMRENGLA